MFPRRNRQLFLLLGALAIPSVAIGWLGWQVMDQQKTLDTAQAENARRQTAIEIGVEVLARLNAIKLSEVAAPPSADGYSDPSVALVAVADGLRLALPWESSEPDPALFRLVLENKALNDITDEAKKAAYARQHYEEASRSLRGLIQDPGRSALERDYARIWLAQVLLLWEGHKADGFDVYADLLKVDSNVVNEYGEPLWLVYAASPLIVARAREKDVLDRIDQDLDALPMLARWNKPLGETLTRLSGSPDPAVRARAEASLARLASRMTRLAALQAMPEAAALQSAFPSLGVTPENWRPFGGGAWLVGMGPQTGSKSVVIAVRADDVRRSVEDDRRARGVEESFDFTLDGSRGEPLGENLPGLRADVLSKGTSGPAGPTEPQRFYALSLALIVALTSLGGYLLSRDTRRESRIAELRSQFVSSVSHELKTPLTAIRIFAETLQIKGLATNPQRHAEYLETIVNETERLTRLLNNVLDFSRIERGQKSYHIQNGSLADAVQAAARAMRFPLTEQGFDFQMELADGLPSMPIDADAIEQAVLNLLSNAMKYSGNSRHIALRLSRENGSARIDVTDRGVGIAPEEQKRIFDKFYRVPTPANRAISGTGLGLALVAHIAEAHNGRVEVESKPGEGSTFSIWLPIEDAGAAAPANVALTVGGANGAKSA